MKSTSKKLVSLAILVAAIATSCSDDETIGAIDNSSERSVIFRAFTDHVTRADVVGLSNLNSFRVYALQDGTTSGLPDAEIAWYDTFTSSDNGSTWSAGTTYYWPAEGSMYFFAYNEDAAPDATASISGTTQELRNFTPETEAADQKDLVVAYQTGSYETSASGVSLNFKHALSQIKVTASNGGDLTVKVLGVRLNGLNDESTLTFPTDPTTENPSIPLDLGVWSPANNENGNMNGDYIIQFGSEDSEAITLSSTSVSIMDKTGESTNNSFMVLPQALTAWDADTADDQNANGAYISVLCQISQSDGNGGMTQLFPNPSVNADYEGKYAWTGVALDKTLNPGYCYTFNLDFSNGGGTTDPEQPDPDPEGPVTPVDPNEPAIGGAISFTVTVSGWIEESSEEVEM